MTALFAYVGGSSFVLQEQFGLNEQQFGLAFAVNAVALIGTPQINVLLLRRYAPQRILRVALGVGATLGLVLFGLAVTGAGGLLGVLVPLFLLLSAMAFANPNAAALALSRHGEAAGTAAALLGAVQFGVGGLAAPVVGLLGNDAAAMAAVIAAGLLCALVVLFRVVRPERLEESDMDSVETAADTTAAAVAH
jgi:DHA1 family bicyclomycin/chloramphenicol resistance-like MFS transporter